MSAFGRVNTDGNPMLLPQDFWRGDNAGNSKKCLLFEWLPHLSICGRLEGPALATIATSTSVTRAARRDVRKYDWSLTIEGVNGAGLIASNEQFMFEAPEEDYLGQHNYRFDVNSPGLAESASANLLRPLSGWQHLCPH
jgi:hypothetical protein